MTATHPTASKPHCLVAGGSFGGMRIMQDHNALETTAERLFPASRHRSARIRKKLIRRHGGEFKRVPTMWRAGDTLIVHPALYGRLRAQLDAVTVPASRPPASPIFAGIINMDGMT